MIKFCKKCIMPDSRPRIVFDENGICNACLHSEKKNKINWVDREKEFLKLIEEIKSHSKNQMHIMTVLFHGLVEKTPLQLL